MVIDQYDILLVNLDPTKGSEIKKTRPCIVISPIELNKNLNTIIVVPMTSANKKYPSRIPITHKGKTGTIALDQLRTIDKSRVLKTVGKLNNKTIDDCKNVIKEMLVD